MITSDRSWCNRATLHRLLAVTTACITACAADGPAGANLGVAAAGSPEAAAAGRIILEAGGNAIDAAVAMQFALGVTEPAMSGLGGQTQILVYPPNGAPFVINGTSFSPTRVPSQTTAGDLREHRATTVPATVKTLAFAWQNYGSGNLDWSDLLAPAIRYADSGFVVGPFRFKVWRRHRDQLAVNPVTAALFLQTGGTVPDSGSVFRQPILHRTLTRLATAGADDFYRGAIAQTIAEDMAAHGGWITIDDLNTVPDPTVIPALQSTYRSYDIATLPPPGGGWIVAQMLNLLELQDPERLRRDDTYRVSTISRVLRIGHASRQTNPVPDLVNYQPHMQSRISKTAAQDLWADTVISTGSAGDGPPGRGETTHFTVVDADGMAVSVTASINAYFGARAASAELGFLYNDYMHEFELGDPSHPFALRGHAPPYSSMSPTIVAVDGRPVLALGSPGSARIISAVTQVIHHWIDLNDALADAVARPRLHTLPDGRLFLEPGAGARRDSAWMNAGGLRLTAPADDLMIGPRNAYFGGVHAVALENGVWHGAADPRRDGAVEYARR